MFQGWALKTEPLKGPHEGYHFVGPKNKDDSCLVSNTLGSFYVQKLLTMYRL